MTALLYLHFTSPISLILALCYYQFIKDSTIFNQILPESRGVEELSTGFFIKRYFAATPLILCCHILRWLRQGWQIAHQPHGMTHK